LQANRLRVLGDGVLLHTQASLVANRAALKRPAVMAVAVEMLEYFEAHQRAEGYFMVVANIRGGSLEDVGRKLRGRLETLRQGLEIRGRQRI